MIWYVMKGWGGFAVFLKVGPWRWCIARHRVPRNPSGRRWFYDRRPWRV